MNKTIDTYSDVLVLLPALNEATSINATIESVLKYLPGSKIVVIDNGSDDDTAKIAKSQGASVITEPQRGKGFAVRRGFRYWNDHINTIVMLDADNTYGCEELPSAVEKIQTQGFDMVVGNRIPVKSGNDRKPVFKRGHTIGNLFFTRFSSLLHPIGITDSLSGWRVMSSGFVRSFSGGASGFEIEAELNAHAYILNCAVSNMNVRYSGRELNSNSKLRTYSDGYRILLMNLRLFRSNRPQVAFSLLASPWLIASAALILRALVAYFETGLVLQFPSLIAGVGSFMVAALLFVTGMILQRVKTIREVILLNAYKGHR